MDTKYFQQALDEWMNAPFVTLKTVAELSAQERGALNVNLGDRLSRPITKLTTSELSTLLRRAQELKDADQRKSAVLDRMGA